MFRVVYRKTTESKLEIEEGLSMLEMGEYLNNKNDFYKLKIYQLNDNNMYANPLSYKNGELIVNHERKVVDSPPVKPFSMNELFDTLQKVPPSRKERLGELLYDLLTGEDITKPKLQVVDNKKEPGDL
ncbi:hypothetical protein OB985_05175 [Bacillus cereus]|nr:hypothetical protein [Bacillus cereus]